MTVTVRLFAWLRDAAGTGELQLTLRTDDTGADVRRAVEERWPALAPHLPGVRLAVNEEYRPWASPIREGDTLALIPPVSGG